MKNAKSPCNGNRTTSRHFSLNAKKVQNWKKEKDVLQQSKKTNKENRRRNAIWPDLENKAANWLLKQRIRYICLCIL